MKITTKEVQETAKILDDIIDEYKKETPKKKRDKRGQDRHR